MFYTLTHQVGICHHPNPMPTTPVNQRSEPMPLPMPHRDVVVALGDLVKSWLSRSSGARREAEVLPAHARNELVLRVLIHQICADELCEVVARFKSNKARGGVARRDALSAEKRSEIAKQAASARWQGKDA